MPQPGAQLSYTLPPSPPLNAPPPPPPPYAPPLATAYKPGRPQVMESMRLCQSAVAALQFQDSDTAVHQLHQALALLTQPPRRNSGAAPPGQ